MRQQTAARAAGASPFPETDLPKQHPCRCLRKQIFVADKGKRPHATRVKKEQKEKQSCGHFKYGHQGVESLAVNAILVYRFLKPSQGLLSFFVKAL